MRLRFNIQHILELTRALRLVWQSGSGWTIASVVLLVVQGTLPLLSLYFMKLIIDAITIGLAATTQKVAFFQVAFLIDFAGTVALVGALCHSIARLVNEAQAQVVTELPTTYTSFCMLIPIHYFGSNGIGKRRKLIAPTSLAFPIAVDRPRCLILKTEYELSVVGDGSDKIGVAYFLIGSW